VSPIAKKNGYAGIKVTGDGDNDIISPTSHANLRFGIHVDGAGTNKLTNVDIQDNEYDGIGLFSNITEVHGGVIKNNKGNGVYHSGYRDGTVTIKEVKIEQNEEHGLRLTGDIGQTFIEDSSISKNKLGGVKIVDNHITKITWSSIQSNVGFGVQMDAGTQTTIMDTDVSMNSVNIEKFQTAAATQTTIIDTEVSKNSFSAEEDGGKAIFVRVRACDGTSTEDGTDDVIGFDGAELETTTCDSTDCGFTCTQCIEL
jgi:hypothetical protein